MFLCNYSQFDKHHKPRSTFFMELNPAPFLTHQGANEHDWFPLKQHLSTEAFNVSPIWNSSCFEVSVARSDGKMQRSSPASAVWNLFSAYFSPIILKLAVGSARKATPMGVPAPLSLFLYQKERWWVCGGEFGAKQTVKDSTLKANTAPCLNYARWALQFSHTLALSPHSPIPANTPFFSPLFFFLAGPVKYTAYPGTCP